MENIIGKNGISNDLRVIALCGKKESGKTPTLVLTLIKLITLHGFEIEQCLYNQFCINDLMAAVAKYVFSDYSCVLKKQVGDSVKRIGFTTMGDSERCLTDVFKMFGKCDLYVCAMHKRPGTERFIDEVTKNGKAYKYGRFSFSTNVDLKQEEFSEQRILNDLQSNYLAVSIMNKIKIRFYNNRACQ